MNILLDFPACERFAFLVTLLDGGGQVRSYYATQPDDVKLAILVTRGATLADLAGRVADCSLGWDSGYPGFVFYPGRQHSKVTARRLIDEAPETTLTDILSKAPERRRKE